MICVREIRIFLATALLPWSASAVSLCARQFKQPLHFYIQFAISKVAWSNQKNSTKLIVIVFYISCPQLFLRWSDYLGFLSMNSESCLFSVSDIKYAIDVIKPSSRNIAYSSFLIDELVTAIHRRWKLSWKLNFTRERSFFLVIIRVTVMANTWAVCGHTSLAIQSE